MLNVGVLASGRGSNMAAIARALARPGSPARCAVVVSDRPGAPALAAAERMGVPAVAVDASPHRGADRWEHDRRVAAVLRRHGVTGRGGLVCLAGYMRIVSPRFVRRYKNRIMNIHPALLPAFPGLDAQGQAVEYGARVSGCTVHFVDDGVDTGPVILQAPVAVRGGDTRETLAARILRAEHRAYPRAVEMFARGMLRVSGRRVVVSEGAGVGARRAAGARRAPAPRRAAARDQL